jgi:hypothetical protein
MYGRVIVLMVTFCCVSLSDAATQFDLNFTQSTNKVIVKDFYFMLEYAIVKGRRANGNA